MPVPALAFVTVEALLIVAAGLAALGAAVTAAAVLRSRRRRNVGVEDARRRRAPSPSSVGLADDPIVTALRAPRTDQAGRRSGRRSDPTDPQT
jgi:uncharacterized iron-regulated membrane protein